MPLRLGFWSTTRVSSSMVISQRSNMDFGMMLRGERNA